jgi:hypothetical protein
MDPASFPAATQRDLGPKGQLFIYAANHDALKEFLEDGGLPSDSRRQRWAELPKLDEIPRRVGS